MNNESVRSPKITTVSTTSINNNYSTVNTSISTTVTTSFSSIPSSSSLPLSSLLSLAPLSYSTSAQFDVTVSAIAAVVNASNHLPVTTPPNAAAVVAVAVSSLAAAIIPDTPIVSIAGSTLSEITTTTTSTKTTPTPVPTSKETDKTNNNSNINKNSNHKDLQNRTPASVPSSTAHPSSSSYTTSRASAKGLNPMSVANSSVTGALTNASTTAANAAAAEIENNTTSTKQTKDNSTGSTATSEPSVTKSDSLPTATESKSITATTSSNSSSFQPNSTASASKTDDINVTPNETKSKDFLSESWEESRLKDWDDSKLKELLDEAYSYKNPRDKENKSKTFLQLLEKAEYEDQSYPFRVTSRGSRNLSSSITSNSYHHYQQNPHYHSHSHNNNRSHHHHKQGGSLQDLFEIGLHESQLDCDQTFGIGISGNQRTRRQNHNSRQKKYSSSVSSRQREGGSLPSNVNVTHQLSVGGSGGGVINDIGLMQQEGGGTPGSATSSNTGKVNKKEQRRNALKAAPTTAAGSSEVKENNSSSSVGESVTTSENTATTINSAYTASGGDFIIDMGEPMMDIQQQQKILQCKGQDAASQGHPFYERLANNDKRIPRANIGTKKGTNFAPTTSHVYVDETVCFNVLEQNCGTNNGPTSTQIDNKFLPLDENYKSCKSVLGSNGDKSPEMLTKSNSIYTKISSPASAGSAVLTGTTNNITTLTQRQLDENGNALSELYQNSTGAGSGSGATIQINAVSPTAANASAALLNSCGNVSTSATVTISPYTTSTTVSTSATVTTTFTSGPSQAKAKAKKKSQQERNTTTVDLESVAGYRGKDPVEELVKYIESSGEDKQAGSGSKSGDKKKDRKKDKEKHQKLKKSNSLEELRSGAKMEVHELKRTAATTESNAVLTRQKNGSGGKHNKNNSSSTADINKNLEGKNAPQTTTNSRKADRRSWGNEDLKYLEDQTNANITNEEKTAITATPVSAKERKSKAAVTCGSGCLSSMSFKEDKEIKDKTNERNERNLVNNVATITTMQSEKSDKSDKAEKQEKVDKSDKCEKSDSKLDKLEKRKKQEIPPNAVTVVDILAMESVLPETAEFHVVTKRKKPKKPKVINNLEETTVTFNRTHNFTMQKTSIYNPQHQQMTVRYKYYQHDNSSNTGISNTNTCSQINHQQLSSQQQQQQQQSSNFNSNVVGANNCHHHQQHQNQQQQQQQQQSPQQHNSTETYTNTTDKSRRKSTSSVPPSEKSDSSDLDSVHSLPIKSSNKANNNPVTTTTPNTTKASGNTQQRTKGAKNNNNNNNYTIFGNNNSNSSTKNQNAPAPISYADIARTNKEIADAAAASASGILINNNEISTECRNVDAIVHNAITATTESDDKSATVVNCTATTATTPCPSAATKSYKIKKSQIKQDFPELAGTSVAFNDDKTPSSNANHKTITYSQSLTAVTNPTQNIISTQSHGSAAGGLINSVSDSSPSSASDVNTKASPIDQHKNLIVHQQVIIPPLQYPQQQILQKSKSVENDSITTSSNSSSSSAIYMASLNSNNLDQQYPALEKTVKRHSSANVTIIGTSTNTTNQTPFNFAAAAKQQIATNVSEQQNINANKNSALTTSNTNNNNTIQTALLFSTSSNTSTNSNSGSTTTSNINKKSKEKSPPLLSTSNLTAPTMQLNVTQDNTMINANATSNTTATFTTNPKKSKKERQQQQQQHQLQQSSVDSSQSKQNQNNSTSSSNINSNAVSNKKPLKAQLRSSNSLPLGLASSTAGGSVFSTTTSVNRPAVIILNDDRNPDSCTADNQFTFGDFNEEELKLFDDDNSSVSNTVENLVDGTVMNANETQEEQEKHQQTFGNSDIAMKSPQSTTYFNDSGASCGNDIINNSTSDMLLSTSIDASSPNTSFVANSQGNNGGGTVHVPAPGNNQSRDSGIYTDKTKSSNRSCSSSSSSSSGAAVTNMVSVKQNQKQQMSPTKKENNKLNTFLSNTRCASVHTSMDNLDPPPLPPQQLETCNDIETAIIAAARAAAKHHHNQQPPHHNQQQQQQHKNSNTSSNSSSFSSSSLSSATSSAHQTPSQSQHHNSKINSNKNYHNKQGSGNTMSHLQSKYPQYDEDYDDNDDDSHANTPHSHSPSRPRCISIAGGTVANKEFDIHFIPPTTMPTAFSTQQHNDIIIDFIGSAWEEVANSKVTKVYDGQ